MLIEKARHWPMLKPVLEDDWILGPGIDALTRHPKFAEKLVRDRPRAARVDREHPRPAGPVPLARGARR